jgi:transposase
VKITRGYKVELDLNNKQITACLKHAGCARFAFNWGLARKKQAFELGQKIPTAIDLHRCLNTLKTTDYPWMYEVSKCAPQEALRDLDAAYKNAYRRLGEKLDRDSNAARNLAQAVCEEGLPLVWRELTPVDMVLDLGNKATVVEAGTEHG